MGPENTFEIQQPEMSDLCSETGRKSRNRSVGSPQERSTGGRGFEGFLGESRPCHGAQVSRLTSFNR